MESAFDKAFEALIGNEGGYANHPEDQGRETMWGVTASMARNSGYMGPMRDMPIEVAKEIYRKRYWRPEFEKMPYVVAFQCFDSAVNSGALVAVKWLQRAVGVREDGIIGPITLAAVARLDPLVIVIRFGAIRLQFLASLPNWPSFGRGWVNRVAANLLAAVR